MNEKVRSISEVIELIKDKSQSIKDDDEIHNLWFRAEKKFDPNLGDKLKSRMIPFSIEECYTPLLPNAFRTFGRVRKIEYDNVYNQVKELEPNFKAEFSRKSIMFLNQNNIEKNEWNNYFLMQHYGLNTRLLDWTESALIALYFAIEKDSNLEDSIIWILNPHNLNKSTYKKILSPEINNSGIPFPESTEKKDLINSDGIFDRDELCRKYLEMDFNSDESAFPLAIYPYLFDDRMKVQKACFTIFGNEVNGLLENPNKDIFLSNIVIDGNFKSEIKEELRWLGITKENVYPSLESQCYDIKEKYKSKVLKEK